jgi:hypothetical protein
MYDMAYLGILFITLGISFSAHCLKRGSPSVNVRSFSSSLYDGVLPSSIKDYELRRRRISTVPIITALIWSSTAAASRAAGNSLLSDEVEVVVRGDYLGLGLVDVSYGGAYRVTVQSIKNDAEASVASAVRPGMVLVSVNGDSVEGLSRNDIATNTGAA